MPRRPSALAAADAPAPRPRGLALSRAGATARLLVPDRVHPPATTVRLAAALLGPMVTGVGVALVVASGLGAGPLDVLVTGLCATFGLPFTVASWVVSGLLLVVALAWRAPVGPGTVIGPVVSAPVAGVVLGVLPAATGPTVATSFLLVGIAAIGVGAGSLVASGRGGGVGELLAGIARRAPLLRARPAVARPILELAWLASGAALGGSVGLGTVVLAVLIGPAVQGGHRLAEAGLVRAEGSGLGRRRGVVRVALRWPGERLTGATLPFR